MFRFISRWRRKRILERYPVPDALWQTVIAPMQSLSGMDANDLARLHELASLFLHEKAIEPADGVELSAAMQVRIAAEACVPVLNLGLEYYRGFHAVIVYEDAFYSRDVYEDEAGVLHTEPQERAGEAWHRGPVIVSWADVVDSAAGYNVIIHEMAHKLDMLDGDANGRPPLHAGMDPGAWVRAFSVAFDAHVADVDAGLETVIDAYAATDPGEFFAVCSEAFFETPEVLQRVWPGVHQQLELYYRRANRSLGAATLPRENFPFVREV